MTEKLPIDAPNPWKVRGSRNIYDTPWIKLTEYDARDPGGQPANYGVVHFKNRAVGIVPYEAGYIWLVGQTRFALELYSWEIPAGGCPDGEELVECAQRELGEEAGLKAGKFSLLLDFHTSNSVTDERAYIYLATDLSPVPASPETSEDITVKRIALDDVRAHIEAGVITDGLTVAAIYKLLLMRAEGQI